MAVDKTSTPPWRGLIAGMALALLLLSSHPVAALLVDCRILNHTFDGTTYVFTIGVHPAGVEGKAALTKEFPGVAANIASPAAVITYLKQQIITFLANPPYNLTVTPNDIALWGGPL